MNYIAYKEQKQMDTYQSLVIRNSGQVIQKFIIDDRVWPDEFASEFVDTPHHYQVADGDVVQDEDAHYQDDDE